MQKRVTIIGGGLAGCEAAWQVARAGFPVCLFEMKPNTYSPAHTQENLAELVCSNSLRSDQPETAIGLLKQEMRELGSLVLEAAEATRVPAGKALAVDRSRFSGFITERIESHPMIEVVRREILSLDDPLLTDAGAVILAAGPLASDAVVKDLLRFIGEEHLYFYDAIAPIVVTETVDMDRAWWASRYNPEEKDYLNCPMSKEEYLGFRDALLAGETVPCREFEKEIHFEGCLPIETMAQRGEKTMAFGPLKPVGLPDPRTGKEPYAVVQLRPENAEKTLVNMVGFQTKLKYPEQKRVFRMIPGMDQAEFERMGSIHRNTFVNAPRVLTENLELKTKPGVYLAGQITGVEGYVESAACGLWVGLALAARMQGKEVSHPPQETMLGGLLNHLQTPVKNFQPMNVAFGLTPPLQVRAGKRKRKELYAARARDVLQEWLEKRIT